MTKNTKNINYQLPPPTYEVTYKTYLAEYADHMVPDTSKVAAY